MLRFVAVLIACIVAAGGPASPVAAADDAEKLLPRVDVPFELTADSLEYETDRRLYVARGNVVIRQDERTLSADWMAFSKATGHGVASGDVVYVDGEDTVHTTFVEFNIENFQGVMFDAYFDVPSDQFKMRGAEIAKTGEQTYRFEEGEFTTCRCPADSTRDPWRVRADRADLKLEGYAVARNTTFEVLDVPVLWLPWMIFPVKTKRQSGLLFPEVGVSGRNGAELGLPIFWAAGDPVNVTLTPRWLSKRGFKGDLDVEYVQGERSGGEFFASFIHDEDVNENSRADPFDEDRWATSGTHDLFLPYGVRVKSSYGFVSDNQHPFDFDDLSSFRNDRFLPATAFAGKHEGRSGRFGALVGALYADDLQSPDDTDRDDFLLHRLPTSELRALPAPVTTSGIGSWFVPSMDVDFAYFRQDDQPQKQFKAPSSAGLLVGDDLFFDTGIDGLPDEAEQGRDGLGPAPPPPVDRNNDNFPTNPRGTEFDGVFQEGELLADSGQRVSLSPRLAMPFRLADAAEVYPEVGWHQTLYGSDAQGFEERGLLTGRVDLRTRLRGRAGDALTHLLEPRIGWAFVSDTSQKSNPLYVPATAVPQVRLRQLDFDNVTRDSADRIDDFNGLNFGFGNRLYGGGGGGDPSGLFADFVVMAAYDFADSEWGNVVLDGVAHPLTNLRSRYILGFDPEAGRLDEALAQFTYKHDAGHRIAFSHRYLRNIPRFFEAFPRQNDRFDESKSGQDRINQIDAAMRFALGARWAVTYRVAYSFEKSILFGNQGGVEYISGCRCWAGKVEVTQGRSRGVGVRVLYTILGLGDDSRNPFGFLDSL